MSSPSEKMEMETKGHAEERVTRSKTAEKGEGASQQSSRERTVPVFDTTAKKQAPGDDMEDDSSELSESSEEPSSESSDEEDSDDDDASIGKSDHDVPKQRKIINVRSNRGEKPIMKLPDEDTDIRAFLKDFLPKLKAANDELEAERKAGTLEKKKIEADDGEQDGQYIEMNLGLGVLEEKDPNAPSDSSDNDSDNDDTKEKDVLGKLLRREKKAKPAQIQEVDMKDT